MKPPRYSEPSCPAIRRSPSPPRLSGIALRAGDGPAPRWPGTWTSRPSASRIARRCPCHAEQRRLGEPDERARDGHRADRVSLGEDDGARRLRAEPRGELHPRQRDASAGGQQYWHLGTQGPIDPNTHAFSVANTNPDSLLGVYSLKARKGLPYGFEIAGDLGYLANTSLWVGGADLRWALLEGYRTGMLGYFPDIAIGGGVRTLGGSPKFFLTTVGIDAQISKPIAIDDSAVLTPYVGAQRLIIFADSSVVDLTPSVDPLKCGYGARTLPGNPNATPANLGGQPLNNGMPVCTNSNARATSTTTPRSQRARIHRWRWHRRAQLPVRGPLPRRAVRDGPRGSERRERRHRRQREQAVDDVVRSRRLFLSARRRRRRCRALVSGEQRLRRSRRRPVGISPPRAAERVDPRSGDGRDVSRAGRLPGAPVAGERAIPLGGSRGRFDAVVWANEAARAGADAGGGFADGAMLVEEALDRGALDAGAAAGCW